MKQEAHPVYREVIFKDISSDFAFLTRSTVNSKETMKWEDGKEYPVVKLEISSHSHPFFTGQQRLVDSAGRVERFMRKYGDKPAAPAAKPKKKTAARPQLTKPSRKAVKSVIPAPTKGTAGDRKGGKKPADAAKADKKKK